ncbi:hypothetical protein GCM10011611_67320 [Aliidongia dinghuensis]|uniref:Uncharacterized protein n=1 Tax=Aliidongia dinghuensis TaxID=1867774 RepID=A0A8J2Z1N3_9PROT|nr:hypothetical protein [Aliidongia dinghuensis]GGF51390.1 hypothetical protein GCM10011611_67320 [Aliidongia dinghuensis]
MMTREEDYAATRRELDDADVDRLREQQAAVITLHGSLDAWHDACRRRRAADPDHRLARIILRLIRNGHLANGLDEQRLQTDRHLWGYFRSVADDGPMAWMEERRRIRQALRDAAEQVHDYGDRYPALDIEAVKELMPTWRAWGQIIIETETDKVDALLIARCSSSSLRSIKRVTKSRSRDTN